MPAPSHTRPRSRAVTRVAVLTAVVALSACGADDGDAPGGPGQGATSADAAAPSVADVVTCLTDAGLDAAPATGTDRERIEVRYPLDTTKIDFLDSPADAEQEVEFGEAYDFDDFAVDSVYVLLGGLDEDALADRATITGCLQPR